MTDLHDLISVMTPLDFEASQAARERFDNLIKPKGSLARLEDMVCLYAGAQRLVEPSLLNYPRRGIIIWADTQADKDFLQRIRHELEPMLFLANEAKSEVIVEELSIKEKYRDKNLILDAVLTGIGKTVRYIKENEYKLLSVSLPGAYDAAEEFSAEAEGDVLAILTSHSDVRLSAAVGSILAAVSLRVPVMLDGAASALAALLAMRIAPLTGQYLIASHVTTEPNHEKLLKMLGTSPVLRLEITQGQGEGASLGFMLFDAGLRAYKEMETFAEAGVHAEVPELAQTNFRL
ncbi:MAG: nicotinate-nucleotide--dimethylbenzimidazole phosphoribosyltransferase [Acholeplasmataceae bacterium]|nr:nicotinate-nucleotide--dimethylbenzimidazole phosphoribosyltransferase [Acidaminococcaceae bacterium]NLY83177.1 nicotinate-nucleotide--dimethylbenzimidazole phosphoribosyltransferase [Acholeplasmataceae bacterium]